MRWNGLFCLKILKILRGCKQPHDGTMSVEGLERFEIAAWLSASRSRWSSSIFRKRTGLSRCICSKALRASRSFLSNLIMKSRAMSAKLIGTSLGLGIIYLLIIDQFSLNGGIGLYRKKAFFTVEHEHNKKFFIVKRSLNLFCTISPPLQHPF